MLDAWRGFLSLPHNTTEMVYAFKEKRFPGCRIFPPGRILGHAMRYFLKPGDLVFYYGNLNIPEAITHVGIYVGKNTDGIRQIVNATNETRGVELIQLFAYASPSAYVYMGH